VFWPPAEAAQADYERLRAAAVAGTAVADSTALRFARDGLIALIARPSAEPVFVAVLHGAGREPWSGQGDPRLDALAAGFVLLLDAAGQGPALEIQAGAL
jgi:hypothetical protein